MPYRWLAPEGETQILKLWPYRSLPIKGFVAFITITACLAAMPLIGLLGSPALWVILAFISLTLGGVWWALQRSYADGKMLEILRLSPQEISISQQGPGKHRQDWQANPYWLRVRVIPTQGPVPQYLILEGGPRPVELGRFLSEDERVALAAELQDALARANHR